MLAEEGKKSLGVVSGAALGFGCAMIACHYYPGLPVRVKRLFSNHLHDILFL